MDMLPSDKITAREVEEILHQNFGFEPTPTQATMFITLSRFLCSAKSNCLMLMKGYAGTGKTSTVNSLVKTLPAVRMRAVLLAPTGRAAKVLGNYSGMTASTIHKKIYFQQRTAGGGMYFVLGQNLHKDTLFIVDEASMIGWETYSGTGVGNLLLDLFEYIFNGQNCKLILIGDGAQLPPVTSPTSPALDLKFLTSEFQLTAAMCELTEVVRQRSDSGILALATDLRHCINDKGTLPIKTPLQKDVMHITGADLQECLEDLLLGYGSEDSVIVCRSNKRCNQFNQQIRSRIFFREERVSAGDYIMAVKNNYHWLSDRSNAGFIANGDIMEILRIGREEERYGFHFVNATVRLIDYPDEADAEVMLWINALEVESASMPRKDVDKLYRGVSEDYAHLTTQRERKSAIKTDDFYNALQIKFAYAVTCHKAQGGQWPAVIVDQGFVTDDMLDEAYLKWLYTAVTRASDKLYLLNFSDKIFLQ